MQEGASSDSLNPVVTAISALPNDVEALKALVIAFKDEAQTAARRADDFEAKLANANARESATAALIAHLKLQIASALSQTEDAANLASLSRI